MKEESVDWPVHRDTSIMSRESLTSDLTANSWGSKISGEEGEAANIRRVEGVEVVVPLGVLGGRVVSLR